MCQICGYSLAAACMARMLSFHGPGLGSCSTPGRNIGSILGLSVAISDAPGIEPRIRGRRAPQQYPKRTSRPMADLLPGQPCVEGEDGGPVVAGGLSLLP